MAPVSFWHHIAQPIIGLPPMDGVTDPAFRYIVARYDRHVHHFRGRQPDGGCTLRSGNILISQ